MTLYKKLAKLLITPALMYIATNCSLPKDAMAAVESQIIILSSSHTIEKDWFMLGVCRYAHTLA